ncbi:MAG: MarR family EPS-associated transcriptional regulator [Burkholderiaceae bacterium]
MPPEELDLELLRQLNSQPAASQRKLAQGLGVSVGKLNYCLRALVDRGWVKANNFRRSDNKLAYAYLLTPRGMSAKLRLTSQFLHSKEREFEALQSEIAVLRFEVSNAAVSNPGAPQPEPFTALRQSDRPTEHKPK